ncbi:MAG: hypothetical protein ACPHCN_04995, partial [Mycobacterium sp.]
MATDFETLLYKTDGSVATITLNRPEQLNTIVPPMPDELEAAIGLAEEGWRGGVLGDQLRAEVVERA